MSPRNESEFRLAMADLETGDRERGGAHAGSAECRLGSGPAGGGRFLVLH